MYMRFVSVFFFILGLILCAAIHPNVLGGYLVACAYGWLDDRLGITEALFGRS